MLVLLQGLIPKKPDDEEGKEDNEETDDDDSNSSEEGNETEGVGYNYLKPDNLLSVLNEFYS